MELRRLTYASEIKVGSHIFYTFRNSYEQELLKVINLTNLHWAFIVFDCIRVKDEKDKQIYKLGYEPSDAITEQVEGDSPRGEEKRYILKMCENGGYNTCGVFNNLELLKKAFIKAILGYDPSIVPADNFKSLDQAESLWEKIKDGNAIHLGSISIWIETIETNNTISERISKYIQSFKHLG